MGTLRTIFAISVVLSHVWPAPVFVGGQNAVQLFYVISGFLISFVLVESKTYSNTRDFYFNRYLRLYPIYFAIAVLTLCTRGSAFFAVYKLAPPSADTLLVLSNALLLGQDWVMFAAVKNNAMIFATNFWSSDVILWPGLLVPQAWSLGVELTFYLIAPFVLPKRHVIYFLLFSSLVCRAYLIWIDIGGIDPWSYRFFPTELALFLFGVLSHQVLLPIVKRLLLRKPYIRMPEVATAILVAFSLTYDRLAVPEPYKEMILLVSFVALIPFVFIFQQRYRFDSWIGNLSYPIYICHMLVIECMRYAIIGKIQLLDFHFAISAVSVFVSIVFAIALNVIVGERFEKLRDKFRKGSATRTAVASVAVARA
jgi:peptidoglycan/LPS O-acetylase OafA/YrhL